MSQIITRMTTSGSKLNPTNSCIWQGGSSLPRRARVMRQDLKRFQFACRLVDRAVTVAPIGCCGGNNDCFSFLWSAQEFQSSVTFSASWFALENFLIELVDLSGL